MVLSRLLPACLLLGAALAAQLNAGKRGCGHMTMRSRFLKHHSKATTKNPGAGMTPDEIVPFEESFNDGFSMVSCLKDYMHVHGDKHGDGKFSYKLADISNVSIVHYEEMVPSEDAEPMTHEICFGFCRSIPEMRFFGITNGRDCYCTPYYKQMAGDSSDCDAPCDGNPSIMCGGKAKSSIFEMHACNDAAGNFESAKIDMQDLKSELDETNGKVTEASERMQDAAAALQPAYSTAGDSAASGLLQNAKIFAGKLEAEAKAGVELFDGLKTLQGDADGHDVEGSKVTDTEKLTADLKAATAKAKTQLGALSALEKQAIPPEDGEASKLYYPVMFFVDKEFEEVPSTCGGVAAAEPLVGTSEGCAQACEALGEGCVAFQYIQKKTAEGTDRGICGLFNKLKTATYYTGCAKEGSAAFLERSANRADVDDTKCMVRFADFRGTTLKPDPSGKCKACLKEAKQADRCPE